MLDFTLSERSKMATKKQLRVWVSIFALLIIQGVSAHHARSENNDNKEFLDHVFKMGQRARIVYSDLRKLTSHKREKLGATQLNGSLNTLAIIYNNMSHGKTNTHTAKDLKEAADDVVRRLKNLGNDIKNYKSEKWFGDHEKERQLIEKSFLPEGTNIDNFINEVELMDSGLEKAYRKTQSVKTQNLKGFVRDLVNSHETLVTKWFSTLQAPGGNCSYEKRDVLSSIAGSDPASAKELRENFENFKEAKEERIKSMEKSYEKVSSMEHLRTIERNQDLKEFGPSELRRLMIKKSQVLDNLIHIKDKELNGLVTDLDKNRANLKIHKHIELEELEEYKQAGKKANDIQKQIQSLQNENKITDELIELIHEQRRLEDKSRLNQLAEDKNRLDRQRLLIKDFMDTGQKEKKKFEAELLKTWEKIKQLKLSPLTN